MLTIIFLFFILCLVVGGIYLAMSSGTRGGRHHQASKGTAQAQQLTNPRGDARSNAGLDLAIRTCYVFRWLGRYLVMSLKITTAANRIRHTNATW